MKTFLCSLLLLPACLNAQIVTTVVGTGVAGYADNCPATAAQLNRPVSIAFDTAGSMYIADAGNYRIRMVSASGAISTIAGTGAVGSTGDNGPATDAAIDPVSISTDNAGNIYFTETTRIRKINAAGIITTIAGDGTLGYNSDGIPATAAKVFNPCLGFVDNTGALYFSDTYNHRIRKIDATGIISTSIGVGISGSAGDGGPATAANVVKPIFLSRNNKGELFIPDNGARRVRKVDTAGIIDAFAGTGGGGSGGDGGPALTATVGTCIGAACDDSGNVYITATGTNTIRKIDPSGIITRIAGIGTMAYSGDNGPALSAEFNYINQVVAYNGDLYAVDMYNNRIRKIALSTAAIINVGAHTNNIMLYPNPAINNISIIASTTIREAVVVNMSGQIVASDHSTIPAEQVNIDISNIPSGLYLVRVNGNYTGKFIRE